MASANAANNGTIKQFIELAESTGLLVSRNRGLCACVYAAVALVLIGGAEPAKERLDVPGSKAIEEALKLFRGDLFADKYAKAKKPDERVALARSLQEYAMKVNEDPVGRFVILREARDLATEGGDISLAESICAVASAEYKVEAFVWLAEGSEAAGKRVVSTAISKVIAGALLTKVDESLQAAEFDAAERLLNAALTAARKSQDPTIIKAVVDRDKQFETDKQQRQALTKARETLATKPDDPAANLILGKQLCFREEKWTEGLPYLAKSSDATLRELAQKSLAAPIDGDELVALADEWWTKAEKLSGQAKKELMFGALYWYTEAADKTAGPAKVKVDKRIADARAASAELGGGGSLGRDYMYVPLSADVMLRLRLIPAGTFMMGSPESEPGRSNTEVLHRVRITRPFYLGITEVTHEQWQAILPPKSTVFGPPDPQFPVSRLDSSDIDKYISALNKGPHASYLRFRLPTEAEWEYAARAGTTTAYYWGDDPSVIGEYAVMNDRLAKVGSLKPNRWGLYDMLGNAREMCSDLYSAKTYTSPSAIDPRGPSNSDGPEVKRVVRGGGYYLEPRTVRCAARTWTSDDGAYLGASIGVRIACDIIGKVPGDVFRKTPPSGPLASAEISLTPVKAAALSKSDEADAKLWQTPGPAVYTQFARWVFKRNARVVLRYTDNKSGAPSHTASNAASLPKVAYQIYGVDSGGAAGRLTDADLALIGSLPWITHVDLAGSITESGVASLASLPNLDYLRIGSSARIENGLAMVLAKATRIRRLSIENAGLTGRCLARIPELTRLTHLSLEGNPIDDNELVAIASMRGLATLQLKGTPLGDVGAAHLGGLASLSYLDLNETLVTDEGLANLQGLRNLQALNLAGTKITGRGLASLQSLPISTLQIDRTQITDDALDIIARFRELGSLHMRSVKITDSGLAKLAGHPAIHYLDVASCRIGDASVATFAKMPKLRMVSIGGTQVTPAGIQRLSQIKIIP